MMHFVLELKVILVYLRAVLLVYFLYKVFLLDILKAAIRESVSKMVADLEEGILVVCWGHWRSRFRHGWRFICCRTSFRWNLPQFHTSLCHSLRETGCYTRPRWDERSCHTTRGRNGNQVMVVQANQPGPGMGNRMMVTPVRELRDPLAVPMVSPVPMQALATGMSSAPAGCDPTGGNQVMMDPAARAVEEMRSDRG